MDPTCALKSMLEVARRIQQDYDATDSNGVDQDDANSLAEHVLNLNQWIQNGGALPLAWVPKRK